MGFFNSFKKESEEEKKERVLNQFNIFEGVECDVTFPSKQLKIATPSGLKKGVATLAFGLVGLAATNTVKSKEEKRKMRTIIQIVDKGIVFKQATSDSKDLRIPYENLIFAKFNQNEIKNEPKNMVIIKLLENQDIYINFTKLDISLSQNKYLGKHLIKTINERARGAQYEEAGWGLEHATEQSLEPKTSKDSSLMDELERLGNMYKKGLLTDEEFVLMKKKLIVGDDKDTTIPSEKVAETSDNVCEKCSADISPEDTFCSECGNKVEK